MKYLKILTFLCGGLLTHSSYADDSEWNDLSAETFQINSPKEYMDNNKFDEYSRFSKNVKVKLSNYGVTKETSEGYTYQLQDYGVEILNKDKVYQILKTRAPYNNELWIRWRLLSADVQSGIVAFTLTTNSHTDYGPNLSFDREQTAYIFNLKNNKVLELRSIFASSSINKDGTSNPLDCSVGSMIDYNEKTKLFTFTDRIQKDCKGPINEQTIKKMPVYKVTFDHNLKCVSTNDVAGGCTDEDNINESIYNYPAEFIRMKKK